MAAWRYEISPYGHVVSSIYLNRQRKAGSRKRETGETSGRFYFQDGGKINGGPHSYRTASYPDVFLSRCQFTRQGRREFSHPWSNKAVLPRFFEPSQIFPRRLGKSGFNSTGRSGRAVFSHRILYSAVI